MRRRERCRRSLYYVEVANNMSENDNDNSAVSHKGKTLRNYTADFKMKAILHAEKFTITSAARHFEVDRRMVSRWVKNKVKIHAQTTVPKGKEKKRLAGGGRKPLSDELEKNVLEWILERRSKGLRVSRILIMKKASLFYKEMENTTDTEFSASRGWCENFMRRNGLSLRRKTSVCQKDPDMVISKLVAYVLRIRRLRLQHNYTFENIYAMDETPVWSDMVSSSTVDKTGSKTVTLKSTGHEKSRVSVCLTAQGSGKKMKPFIVFKEAKRDVEKLNKEFHGKCVVASSSNGWMNSELTIKWIEEVLGSFSFARRLLAWDTYECHIEDSTTNSLKNKKFDVVLVPGGCTRYIQAPDVSWNKPFKQHCAEFYDEWLSTVGLHEETDCGNLKAPPRREIVQWILKSWEKLSQEIIQKSFVSCALTCATDGSQDDEITCLKNGHPCSEGRSMLKKQLDYMNSTEPNPFLPDEEDSMLACPEDLVIEEDSEGDEDIDI